MPRAAKMENPDNAGSDVLEPIMKAQKFVTDAAATERPPVRITCPARTCRQGAVQRLRVIIAMRTARGERIKQNAQFSNTEAVNQGLHCKMYNSGRVAGAPPWYR